MKSSSKTKQATKRNGAVAKTGKNAVTVIRPLSASGLKEILWETLQDVKTDQMTAGRADAIAAQAREILRTVKVQVQVATQARRGVPRDVIDFSER
jgi:nucleotide-binding universal stress UspA family protein